MRERQTSALPGYILHARSHRHAWRREGRLSLKSFVSGRALYQLDDGVRAVEPDRYLILNEGQEYAVTIDSDTPVESFCVFFEPGFAERVQFSLTQSDDRLLDQPGSPDGAFLPFFAHTYRHDGIVSPLLARMHERQRRTELTPGWLEERLHDLMAALLQVHRQVMVEVEALPAARQATRVELYERIHRARDYADALYDQPITLGDIGEAASLSPNHLLRTFRAVFGQTPHQFIASRRLRRARQLLRETDMPVTAICLEVGWQSLGTFSTLFKRHTGMSPRAYRDRFR